MPGSKVHIRADIIITIDEIASIPETGINLLSVSHPMKTLLGISRPPPIENKSATISLLTPKLYKKMRFLRLVWSALR